MTDAPQHPQSPALYAGKVVLVTGASRGVGLTIARHFLDQGATVIGLARGLAGLDDKAYSHLQVDVGDATAVQQAFLAIGKLSPHLDIVINNAAVLTSQYALIMSPTAAQAMLNTNLLGPFMVSREAAKLMRKRKWGRIINISSMAVSLEPMGDSIYAASKAGLSTLANVMAKEFAALNVTCNTLAITAVETEMLGQLPRDKVEAVVARLPIPRLATDDDILNVIDFFASERSAYVTAQTVFLGGVN
ncbi:SDR family oxidoreductase [Phenylobacterium sp.]|uniref:SDR family NAD(P)-dependent oxidoreductase n=1 Tax=Phenylobacterium sp. TaxID=1871053 RepID=UPI0030F3AE59